MVFYKRGVNMTASLTAGPQGVHATKQTKAELRRAIWRHRSLYGLLLLPVAYFIIFKYIPLWNAQIAFKDFQALDGVAGSKWVGLDNFKEFFNSFYFWELLRNTIGYSLGKLIVSVPAAIFLSIAIYECRNKFLHATTQTLTYLPHFFSWVIMYGVLIALFSPTSGFINDIIKLCGGQPTSFMTDTKAFPWIVILSETWKEMGWSAIIFLAALMGIDPTLFEAAMVEGANSWQRTKYITLPSIRPVIVIVVLLRLGVILDAGFNQIFMLYSLPVYSVADIIDTWVYRQGLLEFRFGLATAVGLFKGVIGLILITFSNRLIKKISGSGLY